MKNSQYSAESSPPMDQCLKETIERAGIPVRETEQRTDYPAQEQAANRSRAQMYSYHPSENKGPESHGNVEAVVRKMRVRPSKTDPNGSWTGVPENPLETPVQDVDDL